MTDNEACGDCNTVCDTAGTKCVEGFCLDDNTEVSVETFTSSGGAFVFTKAHNGATEGFTVVFTSDQTHSFTVTQQISVLVTVDNLPANWELHLYASQTTSSDRSVIRSTSIHPLRPATLTKANSSIRFSTVDSGAITYMYVLRRNRNAKRNLLSTTQEDDRAVNFSVHVRESVTNLAALGRVNVNLLFGGMYKGL